MVPERDKCNSTRRIPAIQMIRLPVKSHGFAVSLTILAMKSRSHADYVISHILYHVSRSLSSYIIANKTLILSLFCERRSSYFPAKKTRTWSNKVRLILRSFLKLESFGYYNNNRDFVNQQY